MERKPFTVRTAFITLVAVGTGSTAGTLADALAARFDIAGRGAGTLSAALVTLWALDRLNALIDQRKQDDADLPGQDSRQSRR